MGYAILTAPCKKFTETGHPETAVIASKANRCSYLVPPSRMAQDVLLDETEDDASPLTNRRTLSRATAEKERTKPMQRIGYLWMAATLTVAGVSGCATKNYVRTQTAPIVEHTDQLDQKTQANNQRIHEVDSRAQTGISKAQGSAEQAQQNAQSATQSAGQATDAANEAVHRANSLDSVVKGLDQYKQVADVTVTFGFDKAMLTADDKQQLDNFASQLGSAKSYILEVTGGTDSTGSAQYNYDLSQRRADAVVQYLASKYNVAPHRFYLIGIGEDQAVADNKTREGRKQNRRVQVQLLSNSSSGDQNSQPSQPSQPSSTPAVNPGSGR
jgi:OmpA-OmpF porin, OOP family